MRVEAIYSEARQCCEKSHVPENFLGLCAPDDAMARSILGKSLNACTKYGFIIEKCFQPVIQGDQAKEFLIFI